MAVFAIEHRLNIVQPFTNDRGLLRTAVERATTLSVDLGRQTELIRSQLASEIGAPNDPHEIQLKINSIF